MLTNEVASTIKYEFILIVNDGSCAVKVQRTDNMYSNILIDLYKV